MRIKLFEYFNQSTILDEVDQCLVDLRDKGFTWNSELLNGSTTYVMYMSLHKIDKSGFTIYDIKDSLETMIEYLDEKYGVHSYSCRKPDSPGPGIEIKLYDEDDSVMARHSRLQKLYYLNININLNNGN